MGLGTARGGRFSCKENIRWVQIPQAPPMLLSYSGLVWLPCKQFTSVRIRVGAPLKIKYPDLVQLGRTRDLGSRGQRFKSFNPDHK